jgi:phosphodiesterase/alkaline phosphatase D-like protein
MRATTAEDFELGAAAELGAVDERGVRVWVRQPDGAEVRAHLEVEGLAPVTASMTPTAETDWTGALVLSLPEPAPGRPFVCTVAGRRFTGRLPPEPGTHTGFTFGFGSCHQPFEETPDGGLRVRPAAGIYPAMVEHLRREGAERLLLLGDQLYSDMLPSLNVWRGLESATPDAVPVPFEELLARYRRVTRVFFGEPGFRALREAFPTSCMWDDHDIFDNWGSHLHRSALDRRLFEAASRVFCEYQGQRNPGGRLGPPPYHFAFRHGDVGFLVLDVRGARDHERGQMLGLEQWTWLCDVLRGADARALQTLFVVLTVPVAHAGQWMARAFDAMPGTHADSVRDRWCDSRFIASRGALLEALLAWQQEAPARQVFLLSGDVHAASACTVRPRHGRGVLHQLVSSALTTEVGLDTRVLNFLATRAANLFETRWHFERHFMHSVNNFGTVRVEPLAAGGHRVTFQVQAWQAGRHTLVPRGDFVAEPF